MPQITDDAPIQPPTDGGGVVRATVLQGPPGPAGGSLLFGQSAAGLVESLPWRAPEAVTFTAATVTVASAVGSSGGIAAVLINGQIAATLSLSAGETTRTVAVALVCEAGDLVSVERLSTDGGACQVQIDKGTL